MPALARRTALLVLTALCLAGGGGGVQAATRRQSTGAAASGGGAELDRTWLWIGPFASGKTEYEGDPLAAHAGGVHRHYYEHLKSRKQPPADDSPAQPQPGTYLHSEYVPGAEVSWGKLQADANGIGLPHEHVHWQALQQSPPVGAFSDAMHAQYWVVGRIRVASKRAGIYAINTPGLHTFELVRFDASNGTIRERLGPLNGNIYSNAEDIGAARVRLKGGVTYHLFARVRGKAPLRFRCSVTESTELLAASAVGGPSNKGSRPDVVRGRLLSLESVVAVDVRNAEPSQWATVSVRVAGSTASKSKGGIAVSAPDGDDRPPVRIAPGAAARITVPIVARGPAVDRDAEGCARFEVEVSSTHGDGDDDARTSATTLVAFDLRCRRSDQSALMTFADPDGGLGAAAVLRPRSLPTSATAEDDARKVPIIVSMSGVGVAPQQQADSYKYKPNEADKDYTFGYGDLWVLAPERDGPHNWEDVGMRTAMRAIDVLAEAFPSSADRERLIVHGHSRGGHGAWGIATRIPDRVLGVASACGWYSREEYGDANNM